MPVDSPLPPALRGRVFTTAQARRHGLTRGALLGPHVRPLHRGVHMDAAVAVRPDHRARATGLLLPPGGAVSGRWAAHLLGADVLGYDERSVTCVVPSGTRPPRVRGLSVRVAPLEPGEVLRHAGAPVTRPLRTARDLAHHEPLVEAVVALDALLALYGTDRLPEVRAALVREPTRTGRLVQARRALVLVDPRAESPMETRLRLSLVLAGLPPPRVQWQVRDGAGRPVARLDLAYPEHRLGVEYDRGVHDDRRQNARDTARLTRLAVAGWRVLRFRGSDLLGDEDGVVAAVRRALAGTSR